MMDYLYNNGNLTTLRIKNDACYYLLNQGSDVVDCLLSIISKEENSIPRNIAKIKIAKKVLIGINRCIAFQEWKFLHSSSNISSKVAKEVEDGAITIEKLHVTADHMVSGYDPKGYTYMELDRLACIIKNRLDGAAEEVGMLDNCYPIMDVVEEMKYLFDRSINTSRLFSTGAFQGNSGDYYDYCNSLIAEVSFFTTYSFSMFYFIFC
jgi:hypothetical protein